MKTKVKETVDRFLVDVTPYSRTDDFIIFRDRTNVKLLEWHFYTETHVFEIYASYDHANLFKNTLGAIAHCRKPRAGEDCVRSNDLPDGKLTLETWNKIKNAILRYEVVKLSPRLKYEPQADEVSDKSSPLN